MPANQQFELPLTATKCRRRRTEPRAQQSEVPVIRPEGSRGKDRGASSVRNTAYAVSARKRLQPICESACVP